MGIFDLKAVGRSGLQEIQAPTGPPQAMCHPEAGGAPLTAPGPKSTSAYDVLDSAKISSMLVSPGYPKEGPVANPTSVREVKNGDSCNAHATSL